MSLRFEVHVNGHKACTCGTGDFGVLAVGLEWVQRHPDGFGDDPPSPEYTAEQWNRTRLLLHAGGLDISDHLNPAQLNWLNHELAVGDEVRIRILPPGECDEANSQDQPPTLPSRFPVT